MREEFLQLLEEDPAVEPDLLDPVPVGVSMLFQRVGRQDREHQDAEAAREREEAEESGAQAAGHGGQDGRCRAKKHGEEAQASGPFGVDGPEELHNAGPSHERFFAEAVRLGDAAEDEAAVAVRVRAADHRLLAEGRRGQSARDLGLQREPD